MTITKIILLLICIFLIGLFSYLLFNLIFVVSSKKTKALHGKRGGKNVITGTVHNSFATPRTSDVINGLTLSREKDTGKVKIAPNGTFSDHAVFRTLNK